MPRKRKPNISQSSNKARAMKIVRRDESSQQAELRRLEQAVRSAAHRSAETPEQSQGRRERNAKFLASQRAAETAEQSQIRRQQNAEFLASQRVAETSEQTQARRQRNAEFLASQRSAETPEQSQARRQRNAEFLASQRADETPEQSQARRQRNAEFLASQRAAESQEQTQDRYRRHAEYLLSQRAAETAEQSQSRRQQHATYMASQRATETHEMAEFRTVAERVAQRRQTFRTNTWRVFSKAAFEYDETLDYETHKLIKIEAMSVDCKYCGALKYKEEAAGMCCSGGKVAIPLIDEPVQPLKQLFSNETDESRRFLKNIRKYNMCFHMTSFGADQIVSMPGFCPTFTIQGQVYHRIGSLISTSSSQLQFLQLYFIGDEEAQIERLTECVLLHIDVFVDRDIVKKLQQVLQDHNILVHEFKSARDKITNDNNFKVVIHPDRVPRGQHERRFNVPTTNEIAAVIVSTEQTTSRDIVVQARDGMLTRVPDTHRFYDALEYPIIFWKGQEGYRLIFLR